MQALGLPPGYSGRQVRDDPRLCLVLRDRPHSRRGGEGGASRASPRSRLTLTPSSTGRHAEDVRLGDRGAGRPRRKSWLRARFPRPVHGRCRRQLARALEPFGCFIEEPLLSEKSRRPGGIALLPARRSRSASAFSRWDFNRFFRNGGGDTSSPTPSTPAACSNARSQRCRSYNWRGAHCPLGPLTLLRLPALPPARPRRIQEIRIASTTMSRRPLQYCADRRRCCRKTGPFRPHGPCLGVDIDEAECASRSSEAPLAQSVWRHADGSFAEW